MVARFSLQATFSFCRKNRITQRALNKKYRVDNFTLYTLSLNSHKQSFNLVSKLSMLYNKLNPYKSSLTIKILKYAQTVLGLKWDRIMYTKNDKVSTPRILMFSH